MYSIDPRPAPALLVIEPIPAIRNFIEKSLSRHFTDTQLGDNRNEIITRLSILLINCMSIEIESKEMSLGIVVVSDSELANFENSIISPVLSQSIKGKKLNVEITGIDPDYRLNQLREIIRKMSNTIFGWAPGHYEQPVVVIKWDINLPVVGAGLLQSALGVTRQRNCVPRSHMLYTPHEAYKCIANNNKRVAMWIKPFGSLRFYGSRMFLGEIMRLRDAAGWAVRNIQQIEEYILSRLPSDISFLRLTRSKKTRVYDLLETYFTNPCLTLSEEKRGAAIYIIKESTWKVVKKKLQKMPHEFKKRKITDVYPPEWKAYLEQDGAVVLNENGELLAVGCYFQGPGGRKKTAEFMNGCLQTVSFVVSEDGGFYFHSPGVKSYESMVPFEERDTILERNRKFTGKLYPEFRSKVTVGEFVRLDFFRSAC